MDRTWLLNLRILKGSGPVGDGSASRCTRSVHSGNSAVDPRSDGSWLSARGCSCGKMALLHLQLNNRPSHNLLMRRSL